MGRSLARATEIAAALKMEEAALTDAIATASAQAAAEMAASEARAEASWRARFVPHAVWLTEHSAPALSPRLLRKRR